MALRRGPHVVEAAHEVLDQPVDVELRARRRSRPGLGVEIVEERTDLGDKAVQDDQCRCVVERSHTVHVRQLIAAMSSLPEAFVLPPADRHGAGQQHDATP